MNPARPIAAVALDGNRPRPPFPTHLYPTARTLILTRVKINPRDAGFRQLFRNSLALKRDAKGMPASA
jgi:hypothetical protein